VDAAIEALWVAHVVLRTTLRRVPIPGGTKKLAVISESDAALTLAALIGVSSDLSTAFPTTSQSWELD
jgi:hypothetical protein